MKQFFEISLNIVGSLATAIIFLIVALRAFGVLIKYSDSFVMLAIMSVIWIVTSITVYKFK